MSIPVLGTLILTEPKWVQLQMESIDFPIDEYIVINNNPTGDLNVELESIINTPHPYIKRAKVWHMPCNLGVAAGWNLIIKSFINSPYWVIVNHDVSFGEGLLEEIHSTINNSDAGIIHPSAGDFGIGGYDLFALKAETVQTIGLFDENFTPAYGEDCDYLFRLRNTNIKRILGLSKEYYHGGTTDYHKTGMNTSKSLPHIDLTKINFENFEYLFQKWGPGWRQQNIWKTPFNIPNLSLKTTTFDLDFNRKKHFEL